MEPIDTIWNLLMAALQPIWNLLMAALQPYHSIPESTLLILVVAATLGLISTAANRLLVDVKHATTVTREVNAWRREFEKARKSNDKQQLAKLTKKQQAMMRLQSQVAMERMKVSFIFIIPFYVVWIVLNGFFGQACGGAPCVVAFSPIPIPFVGADISFFYWYLICSFTISLPLSRAFGINPEDV